MLQIEAAAGLLEGGRAQADLARGVLEREVEEALQRLVADADMARSIRVLSFLAARQEYARSPPFRHVRRSAVVRRAPVEESDRRLEIGGWEASPAAGSEDRRRTYSWVDFEEEEKVTRQAPACLVDFDQFEMSSAPRVSDGSSADRLDRT